MDEFKMITKIDTKLKIDEIPKIDNSIQKEYFLTFSPTTGSDLNQTGDINFTIQTQDQYLLPSKSFLYLECSFTKLDNTALTADDKITLTNNSPLFLFDRAIYSLNGTEIENIADPGRVSLIKGILSYSTNLSGRNSFGWILDGSTFENKIQKYSIAKTGKVTFMIPLSHIFGFAECYNKIIYGLKHTLTLHRTGDDSNSIVTKDTIKFKAKLTINNMKWLITKVEPNLNINNKLLNMINKNNKFYCPFITRQLERTNVDVASSEFTWSLGTKYDKTEYIILGFQTKREKNYSNAAKFDHCNLETIFVDMNSNIYPSYNNDLKCDFSTYNAYQQYNFAKDFKNNYYNINKFIENVFIDDDMYCSHYPLFAIDVSKQNDQIINSRPDIKIKATFTKNIPVSTVAFCLILSQKIVQTDSNLNVYLK